MEKRLLAALLALALLAGCSTSGAQLSRHNASIYVAGVLDETYSGKASESYYKLVGHTDEDAGQVYADNLEAEYAQRFALRFDIEDKYLTRSQREDFLDLLDTVYQRAAYTVKGATPLEDGRYCVEVSVTPVTFFAAAYADGYQSLREDFEESHTPPGDEDGDMTAAQTRKAAERYARQWARAVYDYLYPRLDAIPTGESVTRLVLVSPDGQGQYALSRTDLQGLDDLILQY